MFDVWVQKPSDERELLKSEIATMASAVRYANAARYAYDRATALVITTSQGWEMDRIGGRLDDDTAIPVLVKAIEGFENAMMGGCDTQVAVQQIDGLHLRLCMLLGVDEVIA